MKISTLSITMLLLSVPDAVIIFYLQAKANRMRNEKFFVTFSSLGTLLLQFLQYSGVISNTVHMFLMFVLIVIVGAVCADGGHFKALQFALMIWLSEILIESLYYVMGYLIFGKHIIVLIMDIRYAVPLKISMNVVCAVAEYGLYKLWVNKVDKMKVKLNSGILIFGTVQIAFLFITILLNYYNLTNGSVTLLLFIVDALAILFNFMLYVLVNVNLRNQQELWKKELLSAQLEKQEIRGRELAGTVQEAYEVRCDIAENIELAGRLLEEREGQQAKDKLQGLVDNISLKYMYSNNKIADAVLADKAKLCGEYGIRLDGRLELPDNIPLTGARLCVVLANILDNAIRACRKMADAKPGDVEKTPLYIKLSAKEQAGFLIIRQENSFGGVIEDRRRGVFSEHGLGLGIVRSIVEETGGMLITEQQDNRYITTVGVKM